MCPADAGVADAVKVMLVKLMPVSRGRRAFRVCGGRVFGRSSGLRVLVEVPAGRLLGAVMPRQVGPQVAFALGAGEVGLAVRSILDKRPSISALIETLRPADEGLVFTELATGTYVTGYSLDFRTPNSTSS